MKKIYFACSNTGGRDHAHVYENIVELIKKSGVSVLGEVFANKVYWIPSYLAREDPKQRVIPPEELISHLADPSIAEPKERNDELKQIIATHLQKGDMVVCMAGGGGDSLDDWIREEFKQ